MWRFLLFPVQTHTPIPPWPQTQLHFLVYWVMRVNLSRLSINNSASNIEMFITGPICRNCQWQHEISVNDLAQNVSNSTSHRAAFFDSTRQSVKVGGPSAKWHNLSQSVTDRLIDRLAAQWLVGVGGTMTSTLLSSFKLLSRKKKHFLQINTFSQRTLLFENILLNIDCVIALIISVI